MKKRVVAAGFVGLMAIGAVSIYAAAEMPSQKVVLNFGPGPLTDQQFGGALMWGGSMIIDTIWVVIAVLAWLRSENRLAARIDAQTLAQLPVVPRPT